MTNQFKLSEEELLLFKAEIGKTKKLKQDTVVHKSVREVKKELIQKQLQHAAINTEFYFSDEYQPLLQDDPIRYTRKDADPYEVKKLRRGDYEPEFFLDLHGLTQTEAKKEIAALIAACLKENVHCVNIMYGHGKNILKKQTPMWLAQHPKIICFHQAPKEFGGAAALLVLIELEEFGGKR